MKYIIECDLEKKDNEYILNFRVEDKVLNLISSDLSKNTLKLLFGNLGLWMRSFFIKDE